MERLADKQAFMSSQMRSSCRHLAVVIIKYSTWEKGIYMLNSYSPLAAIFLKRVPHCLSSHDRSPFTTECFILPQLSLVVWQKNWKSTDYVYFQNRAYQSVIRPLWCSLFIFAANDPCNICPFPPDVLFSIKARLFGILCVGYMCVGGGGGEGMWSIFQMIWMTLLNTQTTQSLDTRTQSLCIFPACNTESPQASINMWWQFLSRTLQQALNELFKAA